MKQFIIIATMFAFSACHSNNDIPRTYIPELGECICSSDLSGNTGMVNSHHGINSRMQDVERTIPIPAYGIESYTHNLPRRAARLPFNYDDYITELKLPTESPSNCLIDSTVTYGITVSDYMEMIKSFMNNGYVTVEQEPNLDQIFSLSGNELQITTTNALTGRIERVVVDCEGIYQFKNRNVLRGERVCLHKQYDFQIEFDTRYTSEQNGVVTTETNRPIFIVSGKTDTTYFEDEILYKTILNQEEFRKRIFKNVEMYLYFPRNNGRNANFILDSRSWQD